MFGVFGVLDNNGNRYRLNSRSIAVTSLGRVDPTDNRPTGVPTITGTARSGRSVFANIRGIQDRDGLNNPQWGYLWQFDGKLAATGSSFTLPTGSAGKVLTLTPLGTT